MTLHPLFAGEDGYQINRRSYRQITSHCGIKRHEGGGNRTLNGHIITYRPVENRLAIFVLANLEKRGFSRCLDKIASRLNQEKAWRAIFDLSAQNEGRRRITATFAHVLPMLINNLPECPPDDLRNIEHGL